MQQLLLPSCEPCLADTVAWSNRRCYSHPATDQSVGVMSLPPGRIKARPGRDHLEEPLKHSSGCGG